LKKLSTKPIDMVYSERLSPMGHSISSAYADKEEEGYAPELVTIVRIDATTAKENGAHIFAPSSSKEGLLH
jgi:hypothetical protein